MMMQKERSPAPAEGDRAPKAQLGGIERTDNRTGSPDRQGWPSLRQIAKAGSADRLDGLQRRGPFKWRAP